MPARRIGFIIGAAALALACVLPVPAGMSREAFITAGLVVLMATWWMTEALPLTATALMPFLVLPFAGVMSAKDTAGAYYSDILFLLLGGAFIALAIERTGLHRRLALGILRLTGARVGPWGAATGFHGRGRTAVDADFEYLHRADHDADGACRAARRRRRRRGARRPVGRAADGDRLCRQHRRARYDCRLAHQCHRGRSSRRDDRAADRFCSMDGLRCAAGAVGGAAGGADRRAVQRVGADRFDVAAARAAIGAQPAWSPAERRLVPIIALTFIAWLAQAWVEPLLPAGSLTDGTIAIAASLALFVLPDGTGRKLLTWPEANRAPWDVIMMFGGGLALAAGMGKSGLADWLGQSLLPLQHAPLLLVALALVALVVLITEFVSNVATATAIVPVVASLTVALGADPLLLAMPAAIAASWGFMLPAGTGPNAIAWATGRIRLGAMVRAGLALDLIGVPLIVAMVWMIAAAG